MNYLKTAQQSLEALRNRQIQPLMESYQAVASVPTAEQVAAMSLEEFSLAGLIVRVHSGVLGSAVLFVSDNVAESDIAARELVVYRAQELRKLALLRPNPEHLRRIHELKAVFEGSISGVEDRRQKDLAEAGGSQS